LDFFGDVLVCGLGVDFRLKEIRTLEDFRGIGVALEGLGVGKKGDHLVGGEGIAD